MVYKHLNVRQNKVSLGRIGLGLMLLAATGCAGRPNYEPHSSLTMVQEGEVQAPERADIIGQTAEYYVGPYDKLMVDVYGMKDLTAREIQVDAGGRISFPLAGVLDVGGRTTSEIQQMLTQQLRAAHVRDPKVSVNLHEVVSRVITVGGEVKKPGLYPVVGQMTLVRAIAKAEGTSEFSDMEDVVVFRTVAGKKYAALYNLEAIQKGAYSDPQIYANDVIMVGDSRSRRLFKDVLAILPAVVTPLVIGLDRLSN